MLIDTASHRHRTPSPPRRRAGGLSTLRLLVAGVAGAGLCASAVALVIAQAPPGQRALAATAQALGIGLAIAVGLLALARRPDDRFARLLVAAGAVWSLTALTTSPDELLYSVGRVTAWVVEVAIVYLLLAFPSGRLRTRTDRGLVLASVLMLLLLYLPTALLAQRYPAPAPWATCGVDCPANAFALGSGTDAGLLDVVRPLRQLMTLLVVLGVAGVLAGRFRAAGPLMRRTLGPVLAMALVHACAMAVYLPLRASQPTAPAVTALGWVYVFTLPVLTLCFAAGLLGWRLFVARSLERLARGLHRRTSVPELRTAMAAALEDPRLRIFLRLPEASERWVDETGRPVHPPRAGAGRTVTEVASDGRPIAAIVHHHELSQDPALVRAVAAYALVALENDRLVHDLTASLDELSKSRARLLTVADGERRRIERDLHDGAQQRLVAIQIRLALVRERLAGEAPDSAAALRRLEGDVEAAAEEVRALAHGIYPPLLTERGLTEALQAAARSAPLPTTVRARHVGRYGPEVESTVYFACLEALQNAAKHAEGATGVTIEVSDNGRLRFEVRDDGAGFDHGAAAARDGAGLANLRDRLAAVGGEIAVDSAPGDGTRVAGVIPVR